MTNEEIQKVLEFVIKQQEGFAGNMDKADVRMTRLEGAFVGVFNMVYETVKTQKDFAEAQKQLAASHQQLVEAQKRTDERLNILISTVERYIEGRNGNP